MATQIAFQEQHDSLNGMVRAWDRRLRAQKTLIWLPRSIIPGMILGVLMLIIARTRPWLTNEQIMLITAAAIVAGIIVMMLAVWLWPRSNLEAARSFDVMFDLGERTSTALELIGGQIHSNDELTHFQLQDAWEKARVVNASDKLPFIWDWRSWIAVIGALVLLIVLLLIPNPQAEIATGDSAVGTTIENAGDEVKRITEDVASNPSLSEEERAQILQQLDKTSDKLAEPEVKPEEAFAALSDSESELRQQSENLGQSAEDQRAAMEQAANALRNLSSMPNAPEQSQQQGQGQDAIPTLDQLKQNMAGMSESERMEAADALEKAADAIEQTNPQAAQNMRDAADALRNGDMQAAQNAMQQAAQNMQQNQQQAQQQQSSAQQMNNAANQLQQIANQLTQAGQQNSQQQNSQSQQQNSQSQQQNQQSENQQGQQGQQNQQSQQGQQGQQQDGQQSDNEGVQEIQQMSDQAGQQGQQQGEGQMPGTSQSQSGQQGQQPGNQGQPGNQASQMQVNSPGDGEQGTSGQNQPSESEQPSEGSGAGDAPGDAGSDQNQTSGSNNVNAQDNNPDGEGEGQMPLVYTPQRVGGQGDQQLFLEPDASDVPATEGEFSQNPNGQSLVPYNQVYGQYRTEANRALESDYIPLGLRDVVRDYFTSLEPSQSSGQ